MLSEREWRSATDEALGANGSWTWTNSIGATVSASSIVREMSSGGAGIAPRRGAGQRQQLADAEHAHAAVGLEQLARADQAPRLADEAGIERRREHDDAVADLGLLGRQRARRTR